MVAILLSEALGLGLVYSHGNNSYLLSSFGLIPHYDEVVTAKNGLEVKNYTYDLNHRTVQSSMKNWTVYDLEMNVHLYSYSEESFDCFAGTQFNRNDAQDIRYTDASGIPQFKVFTIKHGNNEIIITRKNVNNEEMRGFGFYLFRREPSYNTYYDWQLSQGTGESSYSENHLNQDKHVRVQNGFDFSQNLLIFTVLYAWLPTFAVFAIVFSVFRVRKWVKEVNELKGNAKQRNEMMK